MDLEGTDAIRLADLHGDHHGGDDLVADLGHLLHIADDNMDGVPRSRLDIIARVHLFLDKIASIEALLLCVVEVDGRDGVVVVQLHVLLEHIVGFLLEAEELLRRVESGVWAGWVVSVRPG